MNRRNVLGMGLVGLAAMALAGCGRRTTWRRKLIVIVTTPQGEVRGYSVQREEIIEKGGPLTPPEASGAGTGIGGEAVVVEVAPGRYLFALIDGQKPNTFAALRPGEAPLEVAEKMAASRQGVILPLALYPMLVTFSDINDPASVKLVDPANLAATFGPGYALHSITLEITDEKVTKGRVEEVLPLLVQENPIFLDRKDFRADHPIRSVNKMSFLR